MTALEKLINANAKNRFICVGLDTDINKLPESVKSEANPVLAFNRRIIESTKKFAAAYKINFAFYEASGIEGLKNLKQTLEFIPHDVLTIGDAKRGDIGNTSQMYAKSVFDFFSFDSITLHPYMGFDSINPFLEYEHKLNFILALTSNPGADDFEKLKLSDNTFLFQAVIKAVNKWNTRKNCGVVFGATKSEELNQNLELLTDLPVLLPGVGAQGGSLKDVVKIFKSAGRKNYLVNISRGIIYKDSSEQFDFSAGKEIEILNKEVESVLSG